MSLNQGVKELPLKGRVSIRLYGYIQRSYWDRQTWPEARPC